MPHIDFEKSLNPEQLEAVTTPDGPVLVVAGAGSGKTRTLVYRVAWLIQKGLSPNSILLLTFTRKAASTMLERASELLGIDCQRVCGGTFHGFSHRMLRRHARLIGYPPNFTILDRADVQHILKFLCQELGLTGKDKRFPKASTLGVIASKLANLDLDIEQLLYRHFPHLGIHAEGIYKVIEAYHIYKKNHALMDYDDLLINWKRLLKTHPEIRQDVGSRFRHILVDEYQDTNSTQAEIVRLMACGHDNVMVVGDDAQSIYAFRGANFKNILEFPRLFPNCKVIKLIRNYRTTQPNLDCTNAIIAHAREKFTKRLVAQRAGGEKPILYRANDELDQARFVTTQIRNFLSDGVSPSQIAVLFRAGFHSYHLETELNRCFIPFEKRGGLKLVESAHIKDFLSLLRILINPYDRFSWTRVLLLIERLGTKGVNKILTNILMTEDPVLSLESYKTKASWRPKTKELALLLKRMRKCEDLSNVMKNMEAWIEPFITSNYVDDYPRRLLEIQQLRAMASQYDDLASFLADLALDPPEGIEDTQQGEKIVLSTVHSAKGLEWQVVFVISLCEGRFPSPNATLNGDEVEEERRLFYVASTRAKDHLFFCYPQYITQAGGGSIPVSASRFLNEIPTSLLRPWKRPHLAKRHSGSFAARGAPTSAFSGPSSPGSKADLPFNPGQRVRHPIFGPGTVVQMVTDEKVKVCFDSVGDKTLHLGYAKLSVI